MNNLLKKKCIPCEAGNIDPYTSEEVRNYLPDVPGWAVDEESKKISREYKFKDFIKHRTGHNKSNLLKASLN